MFEDISFTVRKGEVVGFFRSGRRRTKRDHARRVWRRQVRQRRGAGGRQKSSGAATLPGAIRSGIGFCTEDRKKEGLALRLPILLNMTLVRLPLLAKLGVIKRPAQRKAADQYMKSISIKAPPSTSWWATSLAATSRRSSWPSG